MAKGQKRNSRETKKPKQEKPKTIAAATPLGAMRGAAAPVAGKKG